MARLGAEVVGADASADAISRSRSCTPPRAGVTIDYRATTAEDLADAGEKFDVVLNMEVVEHVADVGLFISRCAEMVKPDGIMFVATINRTLKALGLAIIGAEYVLRWLPRGTHQYGRLVRPDELEKALGDAGMAVADRTGVVYNPLADRWQRSRGHGRQLYGHGRKTAGSLNALSARVVEHLARTVMHVAGSEAP